MNLASLPLHVALLALAPAAAPTASVAEAAAKQARSTPESGNAPGASAAREAAASAAASTAAPGENAPPAAGTGASPPAASAASQASQAPGGKKKTASKISRTPKKLEAPSRPMNIRSKSFEVLPGAQRAQWKGDVVVERDDMQVFCDVMTAEYGEDKKIKRLTCSGEVHMLQKPATGEQREAWGDLAVFDNSTGVLTVTPASSMTGDKKVRAREGANTMSGDKVTFFVAENRLVVDNSVTIIDMNQVPGVEPKGTKDSKP